VSGSYNKPLKKKLEFKSINQAAKPDPTKAISHRNVGKIAK
jgi:hypothetical protein